jgi:DNA-binding XRE family transcriptional regulator
MRRLSAGYNAWILLIRFFNHTRTYVPTSTRHDECAVLLSTHAIASWAQWVRLTPCLMRPIYVIIAVCPPSWLAALFMKTLKPLHCYVRPYRMRWGLSQDDLAFIIGVNNRKFLSHLENHKLPPTLAVAIALWVIFGTEHIELFPALWAKTEEEVLARANDLYERLQGNSSEKIRMKLDFLEEIFDRAKRRKATAVQV